MRKVVFWILIGLYLAITILTCFTLFADLGHLGENNKTPLTYTFIIETGVAFFALFYKLFDIKKDNPAFRQNADDIGKIDSKQNVEVVTDSPIGTDIPLNEPIVADLLRPYDSAIKRLLESEGFGGGFSPNIISFASIRDYGDKFQPNVNIQIKPNVLHTVNFNLEEFVRLSNSSADSMAPQFNFKIIGDRHVRIGNNLAIQWYDAHIGDKGVFTQYQKLVVTEGLIGVMTVSYDKDTLPEDILLLQSLLQGFGIQ